MFLRFRDYPQPNYIVPPPSPTPKTDPLGDDNKFKVNAGRYVMHCHNVVHEDHSMMVRWDIVEPGRGFLGSRPASTVTGEPDAPPHLEPRPGTGTQQQDQEDPNR